MSFYSVSDSEFQRRYREEFEMVLSGIDCVLHQEQVIYCSSELTSGSALYDAMSTNGVRTAGELKELLGSDRYTSTIWDRNVSEAIAFAEEVRTRFHDRTIVITPAPFSAPGWSQPEYLYFWETLLRTRVKSVWFNRNWEYSNGCTFEFAVALDAGLQTFDRTGRPLHRDEALAMVRTALKDLDQRGFDTGKLRENFHRMHADRRTPEYTPV